MYKAIERAASKAICGAAGNTFSVDGHQFAYASSVGSGVLLLELDGRPAETIDVIVDDGVTRSEIRVFSGVDVEFPHRGVGEPTPALAFDPASVAPCHQRAPRMGRESAGWGDIRAVPPGQLINVSTMRRFWWDGQTQMRGSFFGPYRNVSEPFFVAAYENYDDVNGQAWCLAENLSPRLGSGVVDFGVRFVAESVERVKKRIRDLG